MKALFILLIAFVAIIGYCTWLDSGCELSGVMTWEGKKCFDELTNI